MRCVVLFVLVLAGCGFSSEGPEKIVKEYLGAQRSHDYERACTYLSSADKNEITTEEGEYDIAHIILAVTKYKVGECKVEGNKAKVSVTVTVIDVGPLFGTAVEDVLEHPEEAMKFDDETQKKKMGRMKKKLEEEWLKDGKPPTIEIEKVFNLLKEENQWKIFLDIESRETEDELSGT